VQVHGSGRATAAGYDGERFVHHGAIFSESPGIMGIPGVL